MNYEMIAVIVSIVGLVLTLVAHHLSIASRLSRIETILCMLPCEGDACRAISAMRSQAQHSKAPH